MKKIALLGSTGSIGRQTLEIVRNHPDMFKVVSLSCSGNVSLLSEQAQEFNPEVVAVEDEEKAKSLIVSSGTKVYTGKDASVHAVLDDADIVVAAIMGFACLKPVIAAIEKKKTVAFANKETLVAGGDIVIRLAREKGVNLIPVDSEHSAIFQCLSFDRSRKYHKLIITCSGGAFRNYSKDEIKDLKASDALKHPNWSMGNKITIDSATLMNKGLEVIEACHLFSGTLDTLEAVLHPESIVHSMVEYEDGAVIAQLGYPSMIVPIQLALTFPERVATGKNFMDFIGMNLSFSKIDEDRFPCFRLALESYRKGDNYPCAVNAANEAAVALYLKDKIRFYDIPDILNLVMDKTSRAKVTLETLEETDQMARRMVLEKYGE